MANTLIKEKLLDFNRILTPKSLVYIQKISELKGKQIIYSNQQQEYLNKLQLDGIIESTLYSNAIDGLELSKTRFKELFEEFQDPETDIESEVVRYVKVINLIDSHYEMLKVEPDLILQFHRNIFRYKPNQGGSWKTEDNQIYRTNRDGSTRSVFITAPSDKTEYYISRLCDSYNELITDTEILDLLVIACFILDFLCIHPFDIGNGRVSRLLTHLLLTKSNYQVGKYFPIEKVLFETKSKYFQSLLDSSQGWYDKENDISHWLEYFLETLLTAFQKLDKKMFKIRNKKGAKSEQVRLVINSLPDRFKIADVLTQCPGIARPTINRVLQELRDENKLTPVSLGRDAVWKKQ